MRTDDFYFSLPAGRISQTPAPQRDRSRLLVLHRDSEKTEHRQFGDLPEYLRSGDVLVLNDSRVIPARLRGSNVRTGGRFELLLLEENAVNDWWVMLRPGKRARVGTEIAIHPSGDPVDRARVVPRDSPSEPKPGPSDTGPCSVQATVIETNHEGHRRLRFSGAANILSLLDRLGEMPLPPYITRTDRQGLAEDNQRYQTVYARPAGSVAAPTAGLHFTPELLDQIRSRGVEVRFLTLHVGLGTFAPVKTETVEAHPMHEERYVLSDETARAVNDAKSHGRRIIAVGTTTVRVLESVAAANAGQLVAGAGRTRIFLYPPYDFRIVNGLVTNFHLPKSTLLMLVSAFAAPGEIRGRDLVLAAYAEAIRERYRFFSYGDAMLLL